MVHFPYARKKTQKNYVISSTKGSKQRKWSAVKTIQHLKHVDPNMDKILLTLEFLFFETLYLSSSRIKENLV